MLASLNQVGTVTSSPACAPVCLGIAAPLRLHILVRYVRTAECHQVSIQHVILATFPDTVLPYLDYEGIP